MRHRLTLAAGLVIAFAISVIAGAAKEYKKVGGAIKTPRVIHRVFPKYPADARAEKVEGVVILEVLINSKGIVDNVYVVKGRDHRLDQAAVEAVRQWRFEPATLNGQPVPVSLSLPVQFKTS